jgi:hypothetical protein
MKRVLLASTMLLSFNSFAQDFDDPFYGCQNALGFLGPQLDEKGNLPSAPNGMLPAPVIEEVKLEDGKSKKIYSYQYPGFAGGKPMKSVYTVTKDKQGRVISMASGGDKMDNEAVQQYIDSMVQSATHMGIPFGSHDPMMQVNGKYLPMSRLTKEEAKTLGVDLDELKKLKSSEKKDKKIVKKIRDGYKKLWTKSNMAIPNGEEAEFSWENGRCEVQKVSNRFYDVNAKKNIIGSTMDKNRCNHVVRTFRKYQKEATACAAVQRKVSDEFYQGGGVVGGYNGGAVGGAIGGYTPYGGGIAGGAGFGMGYPGGAMGIGGFGGFGSGDLSGAEALPHYMSAEISKCYMTFGEPKGEYWGQENNSTGGYVGGASGGAGLGMPMGSGNGIGW